MDQHYTQEDRRSGEVYACLMFYEKNSFIYFTAAPIKMLTAFLKVMIIIIIMIINVQIFIVHQRSSLLC